MDSPDSTAAAADPPSTSSGAAASTAASDTTGSGVTSVLHEQLLQSKLLQDGSVPPDVMMVNPQQQRPLNGNDSTDVTPTTVVTPAPSRPQDDDTSRSYPTNTTATSHTTSNPPDALAIPVTRGPERPTSHNNNDSDVEGQVVYPAKPVKEGQCLVSRTQGLLLFAVIAVIIIIVVSVSVVVVKNRNGNSASESWWEAEDSELRLFASNLPNYTVHELQKEVSLAMKNTTSSSSGATASAEWYQHELWTTNGDWVPSSPQGKAWQWLVSDPAATKSGNTSQTTYSRQDITTRFALAVLYFSTDGPAWNNATNWLSTSRDSFNDVCTWYTSREGNGELYPNERIKQSDAYIENCRAHGFRELRLASNMLVGQLPLELGLLTALTTLSLNFNELGGTVPTTLSQLTHLRTLECMTCALKGSTDSVFGMFTPLTSLEKLRLSTNSIKGTLPLVLGSLEKLTDLRIFSNRMTGSTVPDKLWSKWGKAGMQHLKLHDTKLRGTISTLIGLMTALQSITLNVNSINGTLPTEIGRLRDLRQLALGYNKLTGTLPSQLGQLTSLEYMLCGSNRFTGTIFSELGNLKNVTYLDFESQRRLTGSIPSEIGQMQPTDFYLGINQLTGTIPTEIGLWNNSIATFSFGGNKLTGPIPTEIGLLTNCYAFFMALNQFTGTIPTEFGNLRKASGIDFTKNLMTGTIPSELGRCSVLNQLLLSQNEFTGSVPTQVCSNFPATDETKLVMIDCTEVQCACNCTCDLPYEQ